MPDFVTAAKVSEISEGEGKVVNVGGKDIAIFNVEGEFYAISAKSLFIFFPARLMNYA